MRCSDEVCALGIYMEFSSHMWNMWRYNLVGGFLAGFGVTRRDF